MFQSFKNTISDISPFKKKTKVRQMDEMIISQVKQRAMVLERARQKKLKAVRNVQSTNSTKLYEQQLSNEKNKKKKPLKVIPSVVECDICSKKHDEAPCIYNPQHKAFYCFECYNSWREHQSFLDGLTYSKSADSILETRRGLNEEMIGSDGTPPLSIEKRRKNFKETLSKWQVRARNTNNNNRSY